MGQGQRVRIIGGPWPERIGCTGVTVQPANQADARRYPWAKLPSNEVVILLDDDPLASTRDNPPWTCVLSRSSLEASA